MYANNSSYIKNCTFETEGILPNSLLPNTFIKLTQIKNITLTGNTFINHSPELYSLNDRGKGIYSTSSKFTLNPYCSVIVQAGQPCPEASRTPNTFENLSTAVYASDYSGAGTINIQYATFTNNRKGIFLTNLNSPILKNNNFTIFGSPDYNETYGIYLNSCINYKVENNTFNGNANSYYGIYLNNTGTAFNEIYRNTFNTIKNGIQAGISNSGLQLKCNTFNNLNYGNIVVTGDIATIQGTCTNYLSPSNNIFNGSGFDIQINYDPYSLYSFYYYNFQTGTNTQPDVYTDNITLNSCTNLSGTMNFSTSCPDRTTISLPRSQLIATITQSKQTSETLMQKIDAGNTQTLLNTVNNTQAPGQIKTKLLSASPYLSDTVLVAAIKRPNPLPDGIVKELLVANSPLTNKVIKAIITRPNQLSAGIINEVYNVQTGTSARKQLEEEIAYYTIQKGEATNELIQQYLNDTIILNATDSLITFLQTLSDKESLLLLIQTYLNNNQCTQAKILLSQYPRQTEEDNNFYVLNTILADLCTDGLTVFEINSMQEQTIRGIAASNTTVAGAALSILALVFDEPIIETFETPFIYDSLTIKGTLLESTNCGGMPVANDTLYLFDQDNNLLTSVMPTVTDNNGNFSFNKFYLSFLDSNAVYTINTNNGFTIENPEFKTLQEWYNNSPLELRLTKVNLEWTDLYSTVDSLYNGGTVLDLNGNLYVAGYTNTPFNNNDFLIIKYSPMGERLWINTYNGSANFVDIAVDIAVDNENNCYVLGNSAGTGTLQDIVLLKYNTDGSKLWEKRINGTANTNDDAKSIVIDASNNVFITGTIENNSTGKDIVTIKYSKKGQLKWQKTYSTTNNEYSITLKIDNSGNIIVAGYGSDYITIKYNTTGSQLWLKQYDSGLGDVVYDLATDNNDNIYVVGAGVDLTTIKYNSSGVQQWVSHTIGRAYDIVTDNEGNIYITGNVSYDGFTLKYDPNGSQQWKNLYTTSYYNGVESFQAIAIDNNNDVYVTGFSGTETFAKYYDMLTIKYDSESNEKWRDIQSGGYHTQNRGNDIVVSENNSVYITGIINENSLYKMATLKYSQCPSTASLKSGISSILLQENSENEKEPSAEQQPGEITCMLFPNPNTGNMDIKYYFPKGQGGKLIIYNASGQEVAKYHLKADNHIAFINDAGLFVNGVYLYKVILDGNDVFQGKLVMAK